MDVSFKQTTTEKKKHTLIVRIIGMHVSKLFHKTSMNIYL